MPARHFPVANNTAQAASPITFTMPHGQAAVQKDAKCVHLHLYLLPSGSNYHEYMSQPFNNVQGNTTSDMMRYYSLLSLIIS